MSSRIHELTIANGASVSDGVDLREGDRVIGVSIPVAWTAADIQFELEIGGNWVRVADSANAVVKVTSIPTAARRVMMLPAAVMGRHFHSKLRLVSANTASEVGVNQGAERKVGLVIERFM